MSGVRAEVFTCSPSPSLQIQEQSAKDNSNEPNRSLSSAGTAPTEAYTGKHCHLSVPLLLPFLSWEQADRFSCESLTVKYSQRTRIARWVKQTDFGPSDEIREQLRKRKILQMGDIFISYRFGRRYIHFLSKLQMNYLLLCY